MAIKRRRSANRWLVITQIIILSLALVMLLFFRGLIASGASSVFGAFGNDDIQVQAPADPTHPAAPTSDPRPLDVELDIDRPAQPGAAPAKAAE